MIIPYRTQQAFKHFLSVLLILVLVAIVVLLCWFVWLSRYIVYTREHGAVFGTISAADISGQVAVPPEDDSTVSIFYNEGDNAIDTEVSTELTQIIGYYADANAIKEGVDTVRSQIQELPDEVPVMLDIKSITGNFFYSSNVSSDRDSSVDIAAMDSLLRYLKTSGRYTIARFPALRDRNYGLNHVDDGVFHTSRLYLYMDDESCYWLNPASQGTLTYLVQIVTELKELGFDEVVFDDFHFPDAENIYVSGSKEQAIATAAQTLTTTCATETFAVSFVGNTDFVLPEGRTRLYVEDISAINVSKAAENTGITDPIIRLVFLTEYHDTRYNTYSVMRPLDAAH